MSGNEEYVYFYETHCHDYWCSGCAHNSPEEMAEVYYNAGYAGIVLTNHFLLGNTAVDRSLPWEEKMRCYYRSYEAAKKWAEGKDFEVFFGLEHLYASGKEVLTYGIDLDFLLANPDLHLKPLSEYYRLVHEAGGFISMAHPFRRAMYIDPDVKPQPKYLDAAEIFNFCNERSENEEAAEFAERHGLLATSGGDVHSIHEEGIGMAGIATKKRISSSAELVSILKSGDYRLIINGEVC